MSAALSISALAVSVGGRPVLGPLDLVVEEGEHVLIVGPSGCGKTTLLRTIAGLAPSRSGKLVLAGRTVDEGGRQLVPPHERGVGLLFQSGALWPHMSARKQLEFVLARRGLSRAERRSRSTELLELVELSGLAKRKPGTLSGGEAQRLALARALASEPALLLLDEPLGPLDAELRTSMLARFTELQERLGFTLLHVTHDPAEAGAVASRCLRLADGTIEVDA